MTNDDIRALRMGAQISQTLFWAQVGIGQSTGSRYETGVAPIPNPVATMLTIAYGTEAQAQAAVRKLREGAPA